MVDDREELRLVVHLEKETPHGGLVGFLEPLEPALVDFPCAWRIEAKG